jgi:hypothetical protein
MERFLMHATAFSLGLIAGIVIVTLVFKVETGPTSNAETIKADTEMKLY